MQFPYHVISCNSLAGKNFDPRANEAPNDAKSSVYYEMLTVVCNCVDSQKENSLSYTKARWLS